MAKALFSFRAKGLWKWYSSMPGLTLFGCKKRAGMYSVFTFGSQTLRFWYFCVSLCEGTANSGMYCMGDAKSNSFPRFHSSFSPLCLTSLVFCLSSFAFSLSPSPLASRLCLPPAGWEDVLRIKKWTCRSREPGFVCKDLGICCFDYLLL